MGANNSGVWGLGVGVFVCESVFIGGLIGCIFFTEGYHYNYF